MDCDSANERATAQRGLVVGWNLVPGVCLFQSHIGKLCGIKHFSAALALNELCIVLAGDDLHNGMFALWGHE